MSAYPPSSLMGLPVELRLAIFEFALAEEHISLRRRQSRSLSHTPTKWDGTAFLAINAQIRREIYPIYLDSATFHIYEGFTEQDLRRWMEIIGHENLPILNTLVFHCIGRCSMYGLQPDTDYCHRTATLSRDSPIRRVGGFVPFDVDVCSNRAFGCVEAGKAALNGLIHALHPTPRPGGHDLLASDLLTLLKIMTDDQSSSAA